MTITITEKEYYAIGQVLDQVCTDYEAASDENYHQSMGESIKLVNNVIAKYKKARQKAADFQYIRAEVSRYYRNKRLSPRDIDKITRRVIRKAKLDGQ